MTDTRRIGTLIPTVLRRAATRHKLLFTIQRQWPSLAGQALAAHTKPVSLRRGRLIVHAEQSGDSFALNYARPRLLERLKKITQGHVEEVVIRVGDV